MTPIPFAFCLLHFAFCLFSTLHYTPIFGNGCTIAPHFTKRSRSACRSTGSEPVRDRRLDRGSVRNVGVCVKLLGMNNSGCMMPGIGHTLHIPGKGRDIFGASESCWPIPGKVEVLAHPGMGQQISANAERTGPFRDDPFRFQKLDAHPTRCDLRAMTDCVAWGAKRTATFSGNRECGR